MLPAAIGPFKIERELGRGGMGVVYLATDTMLDRRVAIKALPPDLAADPDRLARFQREAKVLASLSHPHVGGIYGLESVDGQQYLVLEYIDGETLADRLAGGPIPIAEAIALGKQIAEALEAAHEKGIIHRDLKPGNVMVTAEGVVKVLDFGLARTAEGSPSSTNAAIKPDSPTLVSLPRHSPTIPGAIMGTAGYMSPEQARGKAVDKRSDIFSFGCVLYEMLTGAGPFPGETVTDSLGAILHSEPNWSMLPPATPRRVRELLTTCLTKDRKNRLHDIADARLELERAIAGHEWMSAASPALGRRRSRLALGVGLLAAVVAGAAGWLIASKLSHGAPEKPSQSFHLAATTPAKPELRAVAGISPDGRFVVYVAWADAQADTVKPQGVLVVRRLDREETKIIEGTEGAMEAALSADGRSLAFCAAKDRAGSKHLLRKIALDDGRPSGAPETLCELPVGGAPALCWSSDREIIMALAWDRTILAVSAFGGEPRVILHEEKTKDIDSLGEVRPLVEGRSILTTRWTLVGRAIKERTEVVELTTGKRTPLLQDSGGTLYTSDGYLVARRNTNSLIAARFDPDTLKIIGEPTTIWNGGGITSFHVSRNGTLAMLTASGDIAGRRLARLDEQGLPQLIPAPPRPYGGMLCVSPDGGRVAVNQDTPIITELPTDLWVYDLARRTFTRLPTQGPSWECVWSIDGQRIAYSTVNNSEFAIWERRADGSGEAVKLYASQSAQILLAPQAWSPDGKVLAIYQLDMATNSEDVLMLERDAGGAAWKATPYLDSPANEHSLRFSPDGKWVLFCSVESGRHELYAQRFTGATSGPQDAAAGRVQVSTSGHDGACWWSPDGKEIRYIDSDKQVMSVQVQTEPGFSASLPKLLYSVKEIKNRSGNWSPDGRMMVGLEGENERPNRIDVFVNFLDEVRTKIAGVK